MKTAKKIYVNKQDQTPVVIAQILDASGFDIVLYVPRNAIISCVENLTLLKREAETAAKKIAIESVDDDLIKLAESLNIPATNPFFSRTDKRDDFNTETASLCEPIGNQDSAVDAAAAPSVQTLSVKRFMVAFGTTLALTAVVAIVALTFPRAEINLVFEKSAVDFDTKLVIDAQEKKPIARADSLVLPGVLFAENKTYTYQYPASSEGSIERKATGVALLYNAYSAKPQNLVKNTRLQTADGKIYRIVDAVTVPAAKSVNQKLVPQSVSVSIVADAAGEKYNAERIEKMTIPGFASDPAKFKGFYATAEDPITGGFVGKTKIPTDADIAAAKQNAESSMRVAMRAIFSQSIPKDVVIVEDLVSIAVANMTVNRNVNEQGEFSVIVKGDARAYGFLESDFAMLLSKQSPESSIANLSLQDYRISKSEMAIPVLQENRAVLAAHITATMTKAFDVDKFEDSVKNKNEQELKALIFSLPGIKSAEVKLWPFWVHTVPSDSERVNIDVSYKL